MSILINVNRAKGKAAVRGEDLVKTSYDVKIVDRAEMEETKRRLADKFEKMKKAWLPTK